MSGATSRRNGKKRIVTIFAIGLIAFLMALGSIGIPSTSDAGVSLASYQEVDEGVDLLSSSVGNDGGIGFEGSGDVLHTISSEEVESLKDIIGVYDPSKDYNLQLDGYGTGLCPPTEEEWDEMTDSLIVLDSDGMPTLSLPSSCDLSADPCFPEVRSQGGQGSCAAWAVTYYAYGYLEAKDNGWTDACTGNDAHLMSPAFTYNKVNGGYDSGSSLTSNSKIICDWGVSSLANMEYDWHDSSSWGDESAWREAPLHRAYSYHSISFSGDTTVDTVKNLVSSGTPVVFAMDAGEYTPGFSDSNYIISSYEYDSSTITHAQTVVGYDDSVGDDGETGAFRIVNSWGSGWGDGGYYWLTYDAFKEIGNLLCLRYLVDMEDHQPSLVVTWEFSSSPTREADFEVGIGTHSSPVDSIEPYYTKNAGGYSHTYPNFMCLDVSEFKSIFDGGEHDLYLEISGSNTAGDLSSFRIELHSAPYVPGVPTHTSEESTDVPMTNPGYVTNTMDTSEDITPPSLSISHPTDGLLTSSDSMIVRWNGSDSGSGIDHFEIRLDSSSWIDVGTQTQYSLAGLDQGTHSVQVRAYDVSGNSATDSASFQVDSLPPSIDIVFPSSGETFNSTSVSITWEGSDTGSGIDKYWISMDNGTWFNRGSLEEYQYYGLSQGSHHVKVRAFDMAGNWAESSISFGVDSVPPDISITSPQNGVYLDDLTVDVHWTAVDTVGIDHCELRVDGGSWLDKGTQSSASLHLEEGTHLIEVRAFDTAGNVDSSSSEVVLDITNPIVRIISPTDGTYLNQSEATFTWEGSDAIGIDHFEMKVDDGSWQDMGSLTSTAVQLDEGSHILWVMGIDLAGNTMNHSILVNVDTLDPLVEITSPSSYYMGSAYVTVSWTGSDQGSGVEGYSLYLDGDLIMNGTQNTAYLGGLNEGEHDIRVEIRDHAGNSAIDEMTFMVDTEAPLLDITNPSDGEQICTQRFEASWNGLDNMSGILAYWISIDGGNWQYLGVTSATEVGPLFDGNHSIELRAMDRAGNTAYDAVEFRTWTGELDLEMISPWEGDILPFSEVTVEWTFGGSPFGLDHFEIRLDDGAWTSVGSLTSFTTFLGTGTHRAEVMAVDGAGNTVTDAISFQVDVSPPTVVIDSPIEGTIFERSFVLIQWTVYEMGSGTASIEISLDSSDWEAIAGNEATFTSIASGSHAVRLRVTDAAGNQGMAMVNFTVASMELGVNILQPSPGEILDVDQIELVWSGNDSGAGIDHFELRVDQGQWMDVGLEDSFNIMDLEDGEHEVTVRVFDSLSNQRNASVSFTVDTISPSVNIITPSFTITNLSTVLLSWEASDSTSGVDHGQVRIDGGTWISNASSPMLLDGLEEGEHTVEVMIFDRAEHHSLEGVSFIVDTVAPQVTITDPTSGSFIGMETIDITYAVEGMDVGTIMEICLDDGEWKEDRSPGSYQLDVSGEGQHTISVRVTDAAGNMDMDSIEVFLDHTPPVIESILPVNGTITNRTTIDISWEVFDVLSQVTVVTISIDGNDPMEVEGDYLQLSDMTSDIHSMVLRATDEAGNVVECSINFTVDTDAPDIHIISPQDGSLIQENPFNLEWSINEVLAGVSSVEFHTGTGDWQDSTGMNSVLTSLVDGEHTVFVRAIDAAGNMAIETANFVVDTQPPEVRFLYPVSGIISNSTDHLFIWEILDSTIVQCTSTISIDGGDWIDLGVNSSYLASLNGEGEHIVSINVTDAVGRFTTVDTVLMIDTVIPTIASHSPQSTGVQVDASVSITFSEPMDRETVSISIDGIQETVIWNGMTAVLTPSTCFDYGTMYTILVNGKDVAGNPVTPTIWTFETTSTIIVCGTVLDDSDRPVADATIRLDDGTVTTTDGNGNFILETSPGGHTIEITKEGYKDRSIELDIDGQTEISGNLESEGNGLPEMHWIMVGSLVAICFLVAQVAIMKRRHR